MNRVELGNRLCQWHSSMSDPIYAVGSFYVSDLRYPQREVVEHALSNLTTDLRQFRRMRSGEVVLVWRNDKWVSLKQFAGYTRTTINSNIADLREIVASLRQQMLEDYSDTAEGAVCINCGKAYGDHYDDECPTKDTTFSPRAGT